MAHASVADVTVAKSEDRGHAPLLVLAPAVRSLFVPGEYFGTIANIKSPGYKSYTRAKRIQGVPWGKAACGLGKFRRITQKADSTVLHV